MTFFRFRPFACAALAGLALACPPSPESHDGGVDAGFDAGPQPVVDSGIDSGNDLDAGFDSGLADSGTDAGFDAGPSPHKAGRYWVRLSALATVSPSWFAVKEAAVSDWLWSYKTPERPAGTLDEWLPGLKPGTAYDVRVCSPQACVNAPGFSTRAPSAMKWVVVDPQNPKRLAFADGGRFVPWGNNYVRVGWTGKNHQFVEDQMVDDAGMALIAADLDRHTNVYPPDGKTNVVRMHLQFHTFFGDGGTALKPEAFARYAQVVEMAEDRNLYVMVTGLNYFYPGDNPAWVAQQNEAEHWSAQALWWNQMAHTLSNSPGVFLYDLMNEPFVPGGAARVTDAGLFKYAPVGPTEYCPYGENRDAGVNGTCFVQFITADQAGRDRALIATNWVKRMKQAIRYTSFFPNDSRHLITVGASGIKMTDPFQAASVHQELDVLSPHLYPESSDMGNAEIAFVAAQSLQSGKPVVVGETFSLPYSPERLISQTCNAGTAAGWIGQQDDRIWGSPCPAERLPWGCVFWDAWYALQKKLGPTILDGGCPPLIP